MEGVECMNEKRWKVSPDQLRALREIRINCQMCTDCAQCPLASDEDYRLCNVERLPETWNLEKLEVESDG